MTVIPLPPAVPPTITSVSNSSVLENTGHSMSCTAAGDPAPSITWMFEGRVLPSNPGGVLVFAPVLRTHAGAYTCTAMNTAGTVSTLVYLDVQCELEPAKEELTGLRESVRDFKIFRQ